MMNEKLLLKGLCRKEPDMLRKLIDAYGGYAAAIIRNIGRSVLTEDDAEEILSDVFLAVWNNAEKIEHGKLRPYIAETARNKTKSRMRSHRDSVPIEDAVFADSRDIQADVEHNLLAEAVRDAVTALPETDSEVLIRFYYYYQKIPEIAEEMNLSSSAVKVRLHRARKKLKQLLTERGYTYEEESL